MKLITDLKELKGKTIERAYAFTEADIVLIFTDGDCASFDRNDYTQVLNGRLAFWQQKEAGIISKSECKKLEEEEKQQWADESRARDLEDLTRLKAKYEGK